MWIRSNTQFQFQFYFHKSFMFFFFIKQSLEITETEINDISLTKVWEESRKCIIFLIFFIISGLSCVVLSVLVLSVSSALLARRYRQGKTYQIEIDKEMWVNIIDAQLFLWLLYNSKYKMSKYHAAAQAIICQLFH